MRLWRKHSLINCTYSTNSLTRSKLHSFQQNLRFSGIEYKRDKKILSYMDWHQLRSWPSTLHSKSLILLLLTVPCQFLVYTNWKEKNQYRVFYRRRLVAEAPLPSISQGNGKHTFYFKEQCNEFPEKFPLSRCATLTVYYTASRACDGNRHKGSEICISGKNCHVGSFPFPILEVVSNAPLQQCSF